MVVLMLCIAPKLMAQSNNQSDVTGPTVTTSDIAANAFTPAPSAATVTFTSPAAATTVSQNLVAVQANLPQSALTNLLNCSGGGGAAAQQMERGLTAPVGAPPVARAAALTQAMRGLSSAATTGNAQRMAQQLQRAATAFRELINSAGEQYLMNPPPELTAAHAVLSAAISNK